MSLALAPMLASQLFGIGSSDPTAYVSVASTFSIVAVLAAAKPASLATRQNRVQSIM